MQGSLDGEREEEKGREREERKGIFSAPLNAHIQRGAMISMILCPWKPNLTLINHANDQGASFSFTPNVT